MAIQYSDGVAVETKILELVNQQSDLRSETPIGVEQYEQWPIRYHLCPERSNLVRHLDFQGLDVLELGAGMGAVSRYLAENARSLTAVEGTEPRFAVLSSRLRDLTNWQGITANIQDVALPYKYDVVCVIGVLEYSELYMTPPADSGETPFSWFLKKAAGFLKEDGVLLLAIENRLGLKYWCGAAEDHLGTLFDGICGYPLEKSPKTFCRAELRALLERVGLNHIQEQFPFPDYKLPSSVLTKELIETMPELAADIAASCPYQNGGMPDVHFFPYLPAMRSLAPTGLLTELANSFLFLACRHTASTTLDRLLAAQRERREIAWHYSVSRRFPTKTVFSKSTDAAAITVMKRLLNEDRDEITFSVPSYGIRWKAIQSEPYIPGLPLRYVLANHAYFERWDAFLTEFKAFLAWSFARWSLTGEGSENRLCGEALDALLINVKTASPGTSSSYAPPYLLFDLEWSLTAPLPKSWFIFRNVVVLIRDQELFSANAPFPSLQALYEQLCTETGIPTDFETDLAREVELQICVHPGSPEDLKQVMTSILRHPFGTRTLPRRPEIEHDLRTGLVELEAQRNTLQTLLNAPSHQAVEKLSLRLKRIPGLPKLLRKIAGRTINRS